MKFLTQLIKRITVLSVAIFLLFLSIALISDFLLWVVSILKWGWNFPPYGYYQLLFSDQIFLYIHFGVPAILVAVVIEILYLISKTANKAYGVCYITLKKVKIYEQA